VKNIAFAGFQRKQRVSHYIPDQLRSIQHHGDFNPVQKVWIHCLFFVHCHGIMRGGREHKSWPFTGKKSHKSLEMKLPLQGQQIQLGTKPWTTVTFHWPVSPTLYSSWAWFNGKYP